MEMTDKVVKVVDLGAPNKNGRIYTEETIKDAINKAKLPMIGIMGMPEDASVQLARASHAVEQLYIKDGAMFAKVSILKTPAGQVVEQLLNEDKVAFRLAGVGNVAEDGTVTNFSITTISAVDPETAA
jgi:hypothetical protein